MTLHVRAMTEDEVETVGRWAQSRTEAARTVERARIIWLSRHGRHVPAIAQELHITERTVRLWLKRFNDHGLDGLEDRPRSGAPPTYTPEEVGLVIATSLTDPQTLSQPFGCWTLDRLVAYLSEEKALPIKRSRISEILIAEGLRWRTQETWFGERAAAPRPSEEAPPGESLVSPPDGADATTPGDRPLDAAFAQKRGPS
jgi:transposase